MQVLRKVTILHGIINLNYLKDFFNHKKTSAIIKLCEYTNKNTTVRLFADKKSKYYLNEAGEIKQLDINDAMKQAADINNAAKKRKKGTFDFYYTAISINSRNNTIKSQNNNVDRLIKKTGQAGGGSIFTMLRNKGF